MTEQRRSSPRPKLTAQEDGLQAVERALAQIMAARHPGTTWVSESAAGDAPTGQTVRRTLTRPPDDDTITDRSGSARRAA